MDAVNESEQAEELVAWIDDLIWDRQPWLKVLLISRPESWKMIMRKVRQERPLAERAYYQVKDASSGDPMEFNYSMEMKPFSQEELQQAYDKYRSKFKLQTPYEELSPRIQEIISDPFHLWVVAMAHEEQAIPENLKIATLINKYMKKLIKTRRLQEEDRSRLENQLMPLMLYEGHYKSIITSDELAAANHPLFRAISGEVDGDAQSMRQSFVNLVNADILKQEEREPGEKREPRFEISFKFERFYEYFAGERILTLGKDRKDRFMYFLHMITRAAGDYLLWEAVKNALVLEAGRPDIGVVLKLCRMPDQHAREMMVSVLTALGMDDRQQVERILKELVPSQRQLPIIKKARQWPGKAAKRNAGRIATKVASNLNMPQLLQTAALQRDSRIRAEAGRFAYHLWRRDHQSGFMILEYLAQHITSGLIPDMATVEPTMALSLSILFENYRDEQVLLRLQSVVRGVISGIFLRDENISLRKRIARTILTPERIFLVIITLLNRLVNGLPRYGAAFTYGDLEKFFSLGVSEKALYKRLVSYIDVKGNYPQEQMEQDFLTVMKQTNNYLIVFIVQLGLIAHTCHDPLGFLPFLQRFFEETKKEKAAYYYMNDVIHVLDNALHRGPMNEDLYNFFISALEECHEFYIQHPEAIRNPNYTKTPEVHDLGPYIFHVYRKMGVVETTWLRTQIQNALQPLNTGFFDLLLTSELPLIGIERQSPHAALLTLAMFFQFFQENSTDSSVFVRSKIWEFLAQLKAYYPSEVDDFLEEQQADKDTRLQIQIRESEENAGALIGQRSLYFLRDYIIMQSLPLKSYFLHVLDKAADYTDIRIWLNYFLREVINVIYGGEILRPRR